MSLPRYPKYKDSGVAWLGSVPEHWQVKPLRRLVARTNAGEVIDRTFWGGSAELLYTCAIDPLDCDYEGFPHWKRTTCADLLLTRNGTPYVHKPVPNAIYTNVVQRITLIDGEDRNFVATATQNSAENLQGYGVSIESLNYEMWKALPVPIAPLIEQISISRFLDHEIARIDALVAEQRRLMQLLKEKRRAVISHAVTKGLNPDAPMKPSGIEWLGEVPAHWAVKRVKFVISHVKAGPFGSMLTKDVYVSSGYRVYGQEQVIPNDFTIGDYFITVEKYEELSQYSVSPGDILISCVGTFGRIAIVPANIEPGIINPRLIRLQCSDSMRREYFVEVMRSEVTFQQLASFSRGGTMDVINIGTLNEILVAVPPLAEQNALLTCIHREASRLDTLTAAAQRAIDLLQERRTALISAAVTGQIDVRQLAQNKVAA